MSLRDLEKGKIVYSENDSHYAFIQDTAEEKNYAKILLPSSSDDGYQLGIGLYQLYRHLC